MKTTVALLALIALLVMTLPGARHAVLELGSPSHHSHESLIFAPSPEFPELLNRAEARAAIANEVLAERMTLLEAADVYLEIMGDQAPQRLHFVPGQSTREKTCRQVIAVVRTLEQERGLPGTRSQKLEMELNRRLEEEARAWEARAKP